MRYSRVGCCWLEVSGYVSGHPGTALVPPRDHAGTTLVPHRDHPGTTLVLPRGCPGTTMVPPRGCPGTTPVQPRDHPWPNRGQPWCHSGTTLGPPRDASGATQGPHRDPPGGVKTNLSAKMAHQFSVGLQGQGVSGVRWVSLGVSGGHSGDLCGSHGVLWWSLVVWAGFCRIWDRIGADWPDWGRVGPNSRTWGALPGFGPGFVAGFGPELGRILRGFGRNWARAVRILGGFGMDLERIWPEAGIWAGFWPELGQLCRSLGICVG